MTQLLEDRAFLNNEHVLLYYSGYTFWNMDNPAYLTIKCMMHADYSLRDARRMFSNNCIFV